MSHPAHPLQNIKNTFYKIQIYDSVLFFYTRY